jgi:hypothetical protein
VSRGSRLAGVWERFVVGAESITCPDLIASELAKSQLTCSVVSMATKLLLVLLCVILQVCTSHCDIVVDSVGSASISHTTTRPGGSSTDGGQSSTGGGWVIGVALTTLGTVVAAVGNLMVTASHRMNTGSGSHAHHDNSRRPSASSRGA